MGSWCSYWLASDTTESRLGSRRDNVIDTHFLSAQFRRASRSIGAQIAEAWGRRRYPRHFVAKLSDADAEQLETRHWLQVAVDCGYVSLEEARDLVQRLDKIGRMLNVMMQKAAHFRTHG